MTKATDATEDTLDHPLPLVTLAVGLFLTCVLAAAAAGVYDAVVEADGISALDPAALRAAVALRTPLGNDLVSAYTQLGGTVGMPILATVVAVGLGIWWRRWTPPLLILVTGLGSLLLTTIGKAVVGRSRPPLADAVPPFESSFSFPSGHSLNAAAIAGIVAYLIVRRQHTTHGRVLTVTAATVFAVSMGLTRVYLGLHWMTDVLVAWALAAAWLTVVITSHRLYLDRTGHRRARQ